MRPLIKDLFDATSRRARRERPRRKSAGHGFKLEALEARELKTVTATLVGSTLKIDASSEVFNPGKESGINGYVITNAGYGDPGHLVVNYYRNEDGPGTPPTTVGTFPTASVKLISFNGSTGDDVWRDLLTGVPMVAWGNGGNDRMYGDSGNDTFHGGGGKDSLYGGGGKDFLYGDSGSDELYGEGGNDTLYGFDASFGGPAADADTLEGDDGNDTAYGGAGGDKIYGDTYQTSPDDGNDLIYGNGGNDTLSGGAGFDYLSGGAGNDYLDGGVDAYADSLVGGDGADTFKFDYFYVGGVFVQDTFVDFNGNPKWKDKAIL